MFIGGFEYMGWIGYTATQFKYGKVDLVAEIRNYLEEYDEKILDIECVNDVVYASLLENDKLGNSKTRGYVFVTSVDDDFFNFFEMCEEMGPVVSECPNRILDLLSPTNEESALAWRSRCREFNNLREQL